MRKIETFQLQLNKHKIAIVIEVYKQKNGMRILVNKKRKLMLRKAIQQHTTLITRADLNYWIKWRRLSLTAITDGQFNLRMQKNQQKPLTTNLMPLIMVNILHKTNKLASLFIKVMVRNSRQFIIMNSCLYNV